VDISIQVVNLTFTYPDTQQPALTDVSMKLAPGDHVALVGPSGSGKTTLANLILKFWKTPSDAISFGGKPLEAWVGDELRAKITVVQADTWFPNSTLRESLLMGDPDADLGSLEGFIDTVKLRDFFEHLEKGWDSLIGDRGGQLSGGEKQRLNIARGLLQKRPVVILDEPTANLDAITERQIIQKLQSALTDRSVLWITHRLTGMEWMDQIYVFDRGSIIQQGTHNELSKKKGVYRDLWQTQNRILME
jgi:ATP-binding cassette subfamily C protein CydC